MTADLSHAVRQVLPSVRADLERLVRIPSVSADPDACAARAMATASGHDRSLGRRPELPM